MSPTEQLYAAALAALVELEERTGWSLDEIFLALRDDLEQIPADLDPCPACALLDQRCMCF